MENKNNPQDEPIRISRDEAMSAKVDGFISRQKSLTGEPGIGKEKTGSRWYLQNWILFGVAGALAAFLMWLVIEPYYNEYYYVQGEIKSLNLEEPMPQKIKMGFQEFEPNWEGYGWIMVDNQRVWLSSWIQEYTKDGTAILNPEELQVGKEVKVFIYSDYYLPTSGTEGIVMANYIQLNPEARKSKNNISLVRQHKNNSLFGFLLFPLIAGAIGLAIGAVEGLVCRLWRRALFVGFVGLFVGLIGGFIAELPAGVVYAGISELANKQGEGASGNALAFFLQIGGRALAWGVAGLAMGLGQGLALRSKRLITYGLFGGIVGGLLGGLLFDPISQIVTAESSLGGDLSRMVGFTVIGLSVGVMIGLVQLLARDVWLRMTEGPLAGKEFLFFKDVMTIGASPKSEIYLFNDSHVMPKHATIRTIGEECQIESLSKDKPVMVNDRTIKTAKLRHGDRIRIGRTSFIFQMKQG